MIVPRRVRKGIEERDKNMEKLIERVKMYIKAYKEPPRLGREVDGTVELLEEVCGILKEYEDAGLAPEQIREMDRLYKEKCKELAKMKENHLDGLELAEIWSGLEKLRKYEVLRQQGRMPVLPCKVGQNVYIIDRSAAKPVTGEVVSIRIGAVTSSLRIYIPATKQHVNRAFEQIGKSVFPTQAADEKKRSGRGGYLVMPLVKNIPKPCDPEWKQTTCPSCGQECWERPLPAGIDRSSFGDELCTECVVKRIYWRGAGYEQ